MIICPKCYNYDKCKAMGYADAEKCANYDPRLRPKTNFDRIKAMSVEEMAEFLKRVCIGKEVEWTMGGILRYLESEVQEDD